MDLENRMCPLCNKRITPEICYEIVMCFTAGFDLRSVPEVNIEKNVEYQKICDRCPYSDLS